MKFTRMSWTAILAIFLALSVSGITGSAANSYTGNFSNDSADQTILELAHSDQTGMKTIGIIGGVSWVSSIEYYRLLNEMVAERLGGLHSAYVFSWPASRLAFGDNSILSVPRLPVSS
jgi:hypothetical protein